MMKHIKGYDKLYEVRGPQYGHAPESWDEDLRGMLDQIIEIVDDSPITFTTNIHDDSFNVAGPFGIKLNIELDKEKDTSSRYSTKYTKRGVQATIDKRTITADNWEQLWSEIEDSLEFKAFVKGDKVEKMRERRLKELLKKGAEKGAKVEDLIVDYLYYSTPEVINNKIDRSGPWATSGTDINTYVYDLKDVVKQWTPKPAKPENKEALKAYNQLMKSEDGTWEGELSDEAHIELDNDMMLDITELGSGDIYTKYRVTTVSKRYFWENLIKWLAEPIKKRLGFESSYLIDRTVKQYEINNTRDGMEFRIQVSTTTYFN